MEDPQERENDARRRAKIRNQRRSNVPSEVNCRESERIRESGRILQKLHDEAPGPDNLLGPGGQELEKTAAFSAFFG